MLEFLEETWSRIQDVLHARVGTAAYESWIRDLRPLALERSVCYFEADNRMGAERAQRLYSGVLQEVLTEGMGATVSVEVSPKPESMMADVLEVSPTRPVVDQSNRTAFLVLKSLLEKKQELPGSTFVFHGPEGVGKTFLLRWWHDMQSGKARFHDGLSLRKAFQLKIRDQKIGDLVEELTVDRPIVIDGIHRFAGYKRAQRELGKILKTRMDRGFLTLFSSRWHPKEVWELDKGLESLLLSGFVTEIQNPSHVGRLSYVRALEGVASRNGRARAVESLARDVRGSYRDLQRAWNVDRNGLRHRGRHKNDYLELIDPGREFRRIAERVAERLEIPMEELLGRGQARRVTFGRQVVALLASRAGLSQAEIGRHMDGRSRASISYCVKTIEARMAESEDIRRQVEGLL